MTAPDCKNLLFTPGLAIKIALQQRDYWVAMKNEKRHKKNFSSLQSRAFLLGTVLTSGLLLGAVDGFATTNQPVRQQPLVLKATPGYDQILKAGSYSEFDLIQRVELNDNVTINYQGWTLNADMISYRKGGDYVLASGNVTVTEPGKAAQTYRAYMLQSPLKDGFFKGLQQYAATGSLASDIVKAQVQPEKPKAAVAPRAPEPEATFEVKQVETPKVVAEPIAAPEEKAEAKPQPAAPSNALTIGEAVSVGLATNPRYGQIKTNLQATNEELSQARALYLPSVDLSADAGGEYTDDPGTRAGIGDDTEELFRNDTSLTMTQLLFDGWETKYENERQKARVASAAHRLMEVGQFVGLDIVNAYLEVLRQRELLSISNQNIAEHREIMRQIEDSSRSGRSTDADLSQVKARLATARAQQANIKQELRFAEADFIREVGMAPSELALPDMMDSLISNNLQKEIDIALKNSPTLQIVSEDVKTAMAEYQGTKATYYPQFDLQLNARDGNDLAGVRGEDTSASALVVMNWNLYRGGGDTARVREFKYREVQSREALSETMRNIEKDVRDTWARIEAARDRTQQFSEEVAANTKVVSSYRDQFNLNRRTLLDVLDAQNELFVSRSNKVNSEFVEHASTFRLLAIKGQLLSALDVEIHNVPGSDL